MKLEAKEGMSFMTEYCKIEILFCCSYDSTTGVFTVPSGGDGIYYFSTYVLGEDGEWSRFDMRLNDDVICTAQPDHDNNGEIDPAAASCSAVVDVMAGKYFLLSIQY